ncbi:12200_t:CDS:1 [Acaulospora colombiana]|uniref:12200_t:CDS:1 n=1 Tax=Acaulospora colombiana TaxID=27376 RepID=A0ACA9NT39_9GLOM|nr:12200_t:CDS:1 [Acaulospora colombiana]
MTSSGKSNSHQMPSEVWWMILDEAIDAPKYFSTIYTGGDWTHDSKAYLNREDEKEYLGKEKQRKTIGSVCRSWRHFAAQRKHRSLRVETAGGRKRTGFPTDAQLKSARRACIIHELDENILFSMRKGAHWQILRLEEVEAKRTGTTIFTTPSTLDPVLVQRYSL